MKRELPSLEKLGSLDSFGSRKAMIPLEARGKWNRRKSKIQWVLLLVFLILPWIQINGNPLILLNLGERKFSLFGTLFFAHDAPLLFFIFAFLAFGLAFVTSVWGRIWCGYACPQTVFIERVYRKIEGLVEGSAIERRRMLTQPMDLKIFFKRSTKWVLFFLVSSIFAHSFAAYFVGSDSILEMIQAAPRENWTVFLVVTSITLLLLFDFGWFREQFCIIMCPYGRFQSVLMDNQSLAIIYDEKRGEPRKGSPIPVPGKVGDCVSCLRCVEVCPTGIDIRQGVQMECIACTACIDACDEIMTKVKKPTGLIRYDNVAREPIKILKPRNIVYLTFLGLFLVGLAFSLSRRSILDATLIRAQDMPYKVMETGGLLNHFKFHLKNQTEEDLSVAVKILPDFVKLITPLPVAMVPAHKDYTFHFFVQFEASQLENGELEAEVQVVNSKDQSVLFKKNVVLLGPKK